MSAIFQTITNILSSSVKEEEQKIGKIESLGRDLRENIADIAKDSSKDMSRKPGLSEDQSSEMKGFVDANDTFLASDKELDVTPQVAASKQLEDDDQIDENMDAEKQQLPRSIQVSVPQDSKLPQVQILSLSVISPGRPDLVLPVPFPATTSKATLFTLKEGSKYRIKFLLTVSNHAVNNLRYTYMVWKSGVRVHQTKKMVGTFSPRQEAYVYELEEGTTPTGFFARGPFLVKSKFVDDDGNCYLDTTYYFDIRKDWGAREKC